MGKKKRETRFSGEASNEVLLHQCSREHIRQVTCVRVAETAALRLHLLSAADALGIGTASQYVQKLEAKPHPRLARRPRRRKKKRRGLRRFHGASTPLASCHDNHHSVAEMQKGQGSEHLHALLGSEHYRDVPPARSSTAPLARKSRHARAEVEREEKEWVGTAGLCSAEWRVLEMVTWVGGGGGPKTTTKKKSGNHQHTKHINAGTSKIKQEQ